MFNIDDAKRKYAEVITTHPEFISVVEKFEQDVKQAINTGEPAFMLFRPTTIQKAAYRVLAENGGFYFKDWCRDGTDAIEISGWYSIDRIKAAFMENK